MTSQTFTQADIDLIKKWRAEALENDIHTTGAFEEFYENLVELISDKPSLSEENEKTVEWLHGASQVNAGVGLFGTMIREYNVRQGLLRFGRSFTDGSIYGVGPTQHIENKSKVARLSL